jgi:hypothetical protein
VIEGDLVGFHFAVLDEESRARVDAHLAACGACVKAFLATKRAIESGGEERPSEAARVKLRAAVGRQLAQTRRRWYFRGVAAAAIVVAALYGFFSWRASHRDPTPGASIDSALVAPDNLNYL